MTAAAVLAITGAVTVAVDRLRKVPDIAPADIEREADLAIEHNEYVGDRLTKLYKAAAKQRAKAVDDRAGWLGGLTFTTIVTVVLVVAEIVVSLLARVS